MLVAHKGDMAWRMTRNKPNFKLGLATVDDLPRNQIHHHIRQRVHGHPVHLSRNGPAMVGLFIEGVHAWKQSIRVLHPLAAHDVVEVTVGQQDLDRTARPRPSQMR